MLGFLMEGHIFLICIKSSYVRCSCVHIIIMVKVINIHVVCIYTRQGDQLSTLIVTNLNASITETNLTA